MKNINAIFKENKVYRFNDSILKLTENLVEGNLKADLVIVFNTESEKRLNSELEVFLMKLLSAVKHNKENTLLINDESGIKFKEVLANSEAKKLIVFGTTRDSLGLNLNLKRYKIYDLQGVECVFADKISILKDDNQRKARLWNLMKKMFNIS